MSPRPKTYEDEEERKEAHRKRQQKYIEKKRGLRQKLSELITGNHALQPENESLQPETTEPKKVVRVVMDTNSNQSSDSPNEIGSEALSSKCVWCGALAFVSPQRGGRCNFCKRFKSIEEMRYMSRVLQSLSILPKDINKQKIYDEKLAKFRGDKND